MSKKHFSWKLVLPSTIVGILFISQIVLGFYLTNDSQIELLAYAGVALFFLSGYFGMAPVFEFRKKGGVKKKESYIHTTKLVDTGVYSIVRHPQFTTFMIWAIAAMLLFQHWIIIVLGIPIILLTYIDLLRADQRNIEKFGDDYKKYMQKVPRANFVLGIIRLLRYR